MNHIKITYNKECDQLVVSSLQVAEDFEKNHKDVMKAIRNMTAQNCALLELFYETTYTSSQNKELPMYLMNRDGFMFLVMGFTGAKADAWKLKYIKAFNEMEKQIREGLPTSPEEKLDLLLEVAHSQKGKVKEIDERVTKIEKDQKIDPSQYGYIGSQVSKRLREVKEAYNMYEWNSKQSGALRHGINRDICNAMDAHPRTQIRAYQFSETCEFISGWNPSSVTLKEIEKLEQDHVEV